MVAGRTAGVEIWFAEVVLAQQPKLSISHSTTSEKIAFVCAQDGEVETQLKQKLIEQFSHSLHILAAYLVRVRYDDEPDLKVALCLKVEDGTDKWRIADAGGKLFKAIFSRDNTLDFIFLSPEQADEISNVTKPFYEQTRNAI